ncbi:MAG: cell envelope integrity protein TolA [Gammaproteobacteria bacterium]|nr:cell envelope integrity protein TolA [Gammaproteobacteria bacterium]
MHSGLWHDIKNHPHAMLASIVLHLVLLVIVTVSLNSTTAPTLPAKKQVKTLQAVVVNAAQVDAELSKLKKTELNRKQKEEARKKRLQDDAKKAQQQRRAEEKRLAELKRKQQQRDRAEKEKQKQLDKDRQLKQDELARLEKKRQAEQQKLAAIESRRKAQELEEQKKKQAAEAEIRRQAEEAELKRRMAEEEQRQAQLNTRLQALRAQYVLQIVAHVEKRWIQPAKLQQGWQCEVSVQQNALGDVTQVKMLRCTGDEAFRSSVERAIRRASPLPSPADPQAFDRHIQFIFKPNI